MEKYKTSKDALKGAWRVVNRIPGRDNSEDYNDLTFWFLDDIIVAADKWEAWEMSYAIKEGTAPLEIDTQIDSVNGPSRQKGIVKIEDDTLKFCISRIPDAKRPGDFESISEKDQVLYIAVKCDKPLPKGY